MDKRYIYGMDIDGQTWLMMTPRTAILNLAAMCGGCLAGFLWNVHRGNIQFK